MTWMLLDKSGFVCDLGTTEGLKEIEALFPDFIEKGETQDLERVASALDALGRSDDADLVRLAMPPLIISDGVVDEG